MSRDLLVTCSACDGEKTVERERRGGSWNAYVGGWEPDVYLERCPDCGGVGSTWVEADDDEEEAA